MSTLPLLQGSSHQFIGGPLAGEECVPDSSTMSVGGLVGLAIPTCLGLSASTFVRVPLEFHERLPGALSSRPGVA